MDIVGRGDGRGQDGNGGTILKQRNATGNIVSVAPGATFHSTTFRDFGIQGHAASSAGHGMDLTGTPLSEHFAINIRNVIIVGMGGCGIKCGSQTFNSNIDNVWIDNCLDHQFDLLGGNALTLLNCYALNVPTPGKAGYRIHRSAPTLIGCTGINTGQYWGIFGDSIASGDATDSVCAPTLIGCNVEDFSLIGIWNRGGGVKSINSYCAATTVEQ